MALIDLVPVEEELNHPLLEGGKYEHTSPFRRAMLHNPDVLEARYEYFDTLLSSGTVDRALFEGIHVAVAQAVGCDYCASSHRKKFKEAAGLSSEEIVAVARERYEELDDPGRTLMEFTDQVVTDPHAVTEDELQSLRDIGFEDRDVIQLLHVIARARLAHTINNTLDVTRADSTEWLDESVTHD